MNRTIFRVIYDKMISRSRSLVPIVLQKYNFDAKKVKSCPGQVTFLQLMKFLSGSI